MLLLEGKLNLALAPVLVGVGAATFWIGGVLLGMELITRYKHYANPRNWCGRRCNSVETQ